MSDHGRRRGEPGDDRGIALLLTALGMVALLVIAALVVDVGFGKQFRRQSQATADASALAAAQYLGSRPSPASQADLAEAARIARDLSIANEPQLTTTMWATCAAPETGWTVPTGATTGNCVSFKEGERLVRVVLPRVQTPGFFGGVVGEDGYEVNAAAQAKWDVGGAGGGGDCGVCMLSPNDTFPKFGQQQIQLGNHSARITATKGVKGNWVTTTNGADVLPSHAITYWSGFSGGTPPCNSALVACVPQGQPIRSAFETRFPSLSYPSGLKLITEVIRDESGQNGPWQNAQNINNCNDLAAFGGWRPNVVYKQVTIDCASSMPPGTYYIAGQLRVTKQGSLQGLNGVTLVFTCVGNWTQFPANNIGCQGSGNGNKGNFQFDGNVTIEAPTTGTYAGMAIIYDPFNQQGSNSQISGATVRLTGSMYVRQSGLHINQDAYLYLESLVAGGNTIDINGAHIEAYGGDGGGGSDRPAGISLYR